MLAFYLPLLLPIRLRRSLVQIVAVDAEKLMKKALLLMKKDMMHIARLVDERQLDDKSSQALVRYSGALLALNARIDQKDKEAKSKLAKLSTPELERLAKKVLDKDEQ
jgi:hypothetical protein